MNILGNPMARLLQEPFKLTFSFAALLSISMTIAPSPAIAQNCFQKDGATICCDGNGNCVRK
jgi:hypothetical protein